MLFLQKKVTIQVNCLGNYRFWIYGFNLFILKTEVYLFWLLPTYRTYPVPVVAWDIALVTKFNENFM